ncbi:MAG: hypothetical protein Q7S29_06095 [Candidatus Peribacter sp.]|nr:hypothetical protein [Candidatus Peribacter sp.]
MVKRPKTAGVTNAVLLQHIQGMRYSLETRLDGLEKRMGGTETRIGGLERRVTEGFADMHVRFKRVDDSLQRLYAHRVNMLGRIEQLEETVGIA